MVLQLEYIPTQHISFPSPPHIQQLLLNSIHHQNIIGWQNFPKGHILLYWISVYQASTTMASPYSPSNTWDVKLVELAITLAHQIWSFRNSSIHGSSRVASKLKFRERVLSKVKRIYDHHPTLHPRFKTISAVPLTYRIQRSTTTLQRWISQLDHQIKISKILFQSNTNSQLSLAQAYKWLNIDIKDARKYPP